MKEVVLTALGIIGATIIGVLSMIYIIGAILVGVFVQVILPLAVGVWLISLIGHWFGLW